MSFQWSRLSTFQLFCEYDSSEVVDLLDKLTIKLLVDSMLKINVQQSVRWVVDHSYFSLTSIICLWG
jgi:hypothetical protein